MKEMIQEALARLEDAHNLRVLFACEAGSRAWGFASRDSDYDVRFIFAWPREQYLRVHLPVDHLHEDLPGDLDVSGWDLRKALHHFGKSNASFYEWINSPVVYRDGGLRVQLQRLMPAFFQPRAAAHHYLGLARQLWPQASEGAPLNGKKFLYVLRAALAARWIVTHRAPPPVPFVELLALVEDGALRDEIERLVEAKQAGSEADAFVVGEALRAFLAAARAAGETHAATLPVHPSQNQALDDLFLQTVEQH